MHLILFFLVFNSYAFGQDKGLRLHHEFYTSDIDLKGNVSNSSLYRIKVFRDSSLNDTVFDRSVDFDTLGQIQRIAAKRENNHKFYTVDYTFIQNGRIVICKWDYGYKWTDVYFLNDKRELISWRKYNSDSILERGMDILNPVGYNEAVIVCIGKQGVLEKTESYSYNDFNKLQTIMNLENNKPYASGKLFYDTLGNLTSSYYYTINGECSQYETRSYNAQSQLVKTIYYRYLDRQFFDQTIYTYNSDNLLIEEKEQHLKGKRVTGETIYCYDYDSRGNWIKKTERSGKRIISYTSRRIAYSD